MRKAFGWFLFIIFVLWSLNGAAGIIIGLCGGYTSNGRSPSQNLIFGVIQIGLAYLILKLSRRFRIIK